MKRCLLIVVVALVAATIGFIGGYRTGPERERQRSDLKFRVSVWLRLYHSLEAGDTNRALADVRFVLWGDMAAYERAFGAPAGSDTFARRFAEAKAITAQVEPGLRNGRQTLDRGLKAVLGTNSNVRIRAE